MDDTNSRRKSKPSTTTTTMSDDFPDETDGGVWASFDQNFRQVQSMLDRNRVLIQQVNKNHRSRISSNMVENVALIQELNGNISKVVSMYSDFSSNFYTVFNSNNNNNNKKSRFAKRGGTNLGA